MAIATFYQTGWTVVGAVLVHVSEEKRHGAGAGDESMHVVLVLLLVGEFPVLKWRMSEKSNAMLSRATYPVTLIAMIVFVLVLSLHHHTTFLASIVVARAECRVHGDCSLCDPRFAIVTLNSLWRGL